MTVLAHSELPEEHIEPYALPLMEGRVITRQGEINTGNIPTAEDIEALIAQSREEGFAAGHAEGFAQGADEVSRALGVLTQMSHELAEPLQFLDQEIASMVADLVALVAKNLIRRQLAVEPDEIVGIVQDAVKQLPLSQREIAVHLHPKDLDIIQRVYRDQEQSLPWVLNADPTITQGGCMVETAVSQIDASVESRVAQIVATMIGDERGQDESATR